MLERLMELRQMRNIGRTKASVMEISTERRVFKAHLERHTRA